MYQTTSVPPASRHQTLYSPVRPGMICVKLFGRWTSGTTQ